MSEQTQHANDATGLRPVAKKAHVAAKCPECLGALSVRDFHYPGARIVASVTCDICGRDWLADVKDRYGLMSTLVFDDQAKLLHGGALFPFWYNWADHLFNNRSSEEIDVEIVERRKITHPLLLNCLDPLYGHMLLALLQSTIYLDEYSDFDLIPIVARNMVWLLPDGVSGAIVVEWPTQAHLSWNSVLDVKVREYVAQFDDTQIAPTLPVPYSGDLDIQRFSRTTPFARNSLHAWNSTPYICFIWRDDRWWGNSAQEQAEHVASLYAALLTSNPSIQFIVVGVASSEPSLPADISTCFFDRPTAQNEKHLLDLYARAHAVVGVHGSNMLLPSAHAAATVELVPQNRWHNAWTASRFRPEQCNASTAFLHRYVPVSTSAPEVAAIVQSILSFGPYFSVLGPREASSPGEADLRRMAEISQALGGEFPTITGPSADTVKIKSHGNTGRDPLGILVLGYNRPHHLQSVLESLRLQGRINDVHVWIDGTQGRGEYHGANEKSVEIARRYAVKKVRALNSHLGIEKMMLDALDDMSQRYPRVLVLEDDCFPLEGAVEAFEKTLDEVASDEHIYSVYGHHFGTEPADDQDFTRFQGWGWAARSSRIRALLPQLRNLFSDERARVPGSCWPTN